MRASEFTINIPITLNVDGEDENPISIKQDKKNPEVSTLLKPKEPTDNVVELEPNPVFIPPLQQDIELKKASVGKESDVINSLTDTDPDEEPDEHTDSNELSRLKELLKSIIK